jgi:uncharacterized protein YndB with AHSA1/START domain
MSNETAKFTLSRSFDAPIEKVWKAWTDESQLKTWFGPKGCPISFSNMDFSVGGKYHYAMDVPDGSKMWGRWTFREITQPTRLRWDHNFSDETGTKITRHPFSATWPKEMICQLDFAEEGGKTKLTLTSHAINVNEVERQTWEGGFAGMTQGWGGTLEQLVEFLKG